MRGRIEEEKQKKDNVLSGLLAVTLAACSQESKKQDGTADRTDSQSFHVLGSGVSRLPRKKAGKWLKKQITAKD